nr:MAG: hypothetical protein [Bacteriophage sp.]
MKKSEFVKELEKIIDMVKTEDDGFEYGGKVIFYKKEDDSNYEVSVMNIEMNLEVEADVMAGMDDIDFTCLMSEVYKQKAIKAIMMEKDDDEDN